MNHRLRTNSGFTLIELMVAMGILAMVMGFASVIFRVSINAHRTALANAEIMQKVRAITDQLNADFKGLNKDGEIFMAWVAKPIAPGDQVDNDLDGYERFDRVMIFADGDFQSHRASPTIRGNTARICYMLAAKPAAIAGQPPIKVDGQKRQERILARNQHIMTDDPALPDFLDPNSFTGSQWYEWNNRYEYDKLSLEQWKRMPFDSKKNALSVITGIKVSDPTVSEEFWGCNIDPADPDSIHMLLCEGVAEFKVQSWYDAKQRWIPEVDPDGDGSLVDTDFMTTSDGRIESEAVPGVLYPYPPYGDVQIADVNYPRNQVDSAHFNDIPGLGRALKFTFTLYDSRGILKEGRTFTHIVYLDK
ncbi:MAG: PulJ/GspJ family protein [Planctomycetota bacterium]|jgi:prepilin-type N-terminal cleavage/methylation domain-containing protein